MFSQNLHHSRSIWNKGSTKLKLQLKESTRLCKVDSWEVTTTDWFVNSLQLSRWQTSFYVLLHNFIHWKLKFLSTYCQLQSQLKLFVLQELLDLCGYGHWNEPPNKVITCHIYNVCAVNKKKKKKSQLLSFNAQKAIPYLKRNPTQ